MSLSLFRLSPLLLAFALAACDDAPRFTQAEPGEALSAGLATVQRSDRNALLAVGTVFFLAELGDKTMLATITLATKHGWFGTWLGSTVGMVAADALAIVVGRALGARLPDKAIKIGAAIAFFAFAALLFVEAARG